MTLDEFMQQALQAARETRVLRIAPGAVAQVGEVYCGSFGGRRAVVVADTNTFAAAGKAALDSLLKAGVACDEPFVFTEPELHADFDQVLRLDAMLSGTDAVPVAVGSGTINDLVKLSAHHAGRRYMAVGTAASVDGYTSFGAAITYQDVKQTFDCPAPLAVLVDLDVVAGAPEGMNASGYADLMAKMTGGADWILAEAAGEDPIDPVAWDLVQSRLREALADPAGVRKGDIQALEGLVAGLMMGGFAMQYTRTSRPASGAEHLFSHLWDMQHHTHNGKIPSHGFKVGVATLAETRLYEQFYAMPIEDLQVDRLCREWPDWPEQEKRIRSLGCEPHITEKCVEESRLKHIDRQRLAAQLERLRTGWSAVRMRLRRQLPPSGEVADMLRAVGAPTEPEQIGISRRRLRQTFYPTAYLRNRYTSLDFALRAGILDRCLEGIFG